MSITKGPQEQYTDDLKRKFGYYATWLPGTPLLLGDIGLFRNNVFTRVAGLEDFGIDFQVRDDDTADNLYYTTKGGVSTTVKFAGTIPPVGSTLTEADAGLIIEFSKENAILFKANQSKVSMIKNIKQVGDAALALFRAGKWNKDYTVITELVKCESASIIISSSNNGKIELKANANINTGKLDIADAKLDFGTNFSRSLETSIIAEERITPLFKIQGIKTRIFTPPVFKERGIAPLDMITPESASGAHNDDIFFGYISNEPFE